MPKCFSRLIATNRIEKRTYITGIRKYHRKPKFEIPQNLCDMGFSLSNSGHCSRRLRASGIGAARLSNWSARQSVSISRNALLSTANASTGEKRPRNWSNRRGKREHRDAALRKARQRRARRLTRGCRFWRSRAASPPFEAGGFSPDHRVACR